MVELSILRFLRYSTWHDKLPEPLMTHMRAIILECRTDKDVKLIVVSSWKWLRRSIKKKLQYVSFFREYHKSSERLCQAKSYCTVWKCTVRCQNKADK